jgi:hypothetical protein
MTIKILSADPLFVRCVDIKYEDREDRVRKRNESKKWRLSDRKWLITATKRRRRIYLQQKEEKLKRENSKRKKASGDFVI